MTVIERALERLAEEEHQHDLGADNEQNIAYWAAYLDGAKAQMPKEGEWLRTDAFPHRVYCSCCYKTYVPNENWQIWQDDADNFGLPRNYCPNCGARMKGEQE